MTFCTIYLQNPNCEDIILVQTNARLLEYTYYRRKSIMDNNQTNISAEQLTEQIMLLIKDEMVVTCTQNKTAIRLYFLNGQRFSLSIEEVQ